MPRLGLAGEPQGDRLPAQTRHVLATLAPPQREQLVTFVDALHAQRIAASFLPRELAQRLACERLPAEMLREMAAYTQAQQSGLEAACTSTLPEGWSLADTYQAFGAFAGTVEPWDAFVAAGMALAHPADHTVHRASLERMRYISSWQWMPFARALAGLTADLPATDDRGPLAGTLAAYWATQPAAEHEAFVQATSALCRQDMGVASRKLVAQAVMSTPPHERGDLVRICRPLLRLNIDARLTATSISLIADTPPKARAAHCNRLVDAAARRHGARDHVDLENVSVYQRVENAACSIEALRRRVSMRARSSTQVLQYIDSVLPTYLAADTVRGGATELRNARRTLHEPARVGDFSNALVQNDSMRVHDAHIGLADLAALVWCAIDDFTTPPDSEPDARSRRTTTQREQHNMRASFARALAECIEDDGHRVCATGISQRLLTVLQGYFPEVCLDIVTPANLLCEIAQAHETESGGVDAPQHIEELVRRVRRAGEAHYGRDTPNYSALMAQLRSYVELQHG